MDTNPADELKRQIDYNTTNMGELGKFIRIEHIYSILENFSITDFNGIRQDGRIAKARRLMQDASSGNERQLLGDLYRLLCG